MTEYGKWRSLIDGVGVIPDSGDYQWYIDAGTGSTLDADVGSVTATISGPSWVSDANAVGGYYLSHSGDTDIWRTDSAVLSTPFTVAGWVRIDSVGNFDNYFAGNNKDNSNGERWSMNDYNSDQIQVSQGGGSVTGTRGTWPNSGEWGFFAANVKSDQSRLITFSNTQELADNTGSHNNNGLGSASKFVTKDREEGGLNGDTDFFVISSGSLLTKTEITELWQATQR